MTRTYKTCTRKKLAQELCKNFVNGKILPQFWWVFSRARNRTCTILVHFLLCNSCRFLLFYFIFNLPVLLLSKLRFWVLSKGLRARDELSPRKQNIFKKKTKTSL